MAVSIIRTLVVFAALVTTLRIMGKRQLGQMEPAELVVAVLISDMASHPLQNPGTPLLYGLVPVIVLLCCEVLVSAGILKSIAFRKLVCGKPGILITDGKINQAEMRRNRVTIDELAEELRKKDINDITSVHYAILETDGTLSTILRTENAPLTPLQLGIRTEDNEYPVIIINDGRILKDNLDAMGKTTEWLNKSIIEYGAKTSEEVYLMSLDRSGKVFFALMDKKRERTKEKGGIR